MENKHGTYEWSGMTQKLRSAENNGNPNDQYQTPTNHDKLWEENITEGTIYLGGTNHKHRLVSKNTATILSYLRDLTTRHRIEQQYKQMQKPTRTWTLAH